jgi:lysophospholipase L1-like esterase
MRIKIFAVCSLLLAFVLPQKKHIKVFIAGDSTAANKEIRAFPETGWGMPFAYMFDSTVTVDNRAKNGRSTKSFISEGLWQKLFDDVSEGDYVFIQFGHNDEVPTKKTYTTEAEFKSNLEKYVNDTRSKKAFPVLLTPVARRKFDSLGKVVGTHDMYSQIVRNVAKEEKVPLIDLDKKGQELLQSFGEEKSKLLFNQLKPGEHPNYPEGREDNTHFNELGARLISQIVVKEIREKCPELAERITKPSVK